MTILISFFQLQQKKKIGFYKLSFRFFYLNSIPRIPTLIPRIPTFPTLITCIPNLIARIPTPIPASPLPRHSPHSPHSVPRFPIPAFTGSFLSLSIFHCFPYKHDRKINTIERQNPKKYICL